MSAREDVRAVPCPKCAAAAGEPCVGSRGKPRTANHAERIAAAKGERATFKGDGALLVSEDGRVLGRVVTVEVDLFDGGLGEEEAGEPTEGVDEGVGQTTLLSNEQLLGDGGSGETLDRTGDVISVWEHYVEVMKPRNIGLPSAERKLIRDALKVADPDEVKKAISGCASSDFHMGHNDRRRKYNALSQIIRGRQGKETTRERLDYFIDLADKSGVVRDGSSFDLSRVPSVMRATVNSQRAMVRRGLAEDDPHTQRMGREAAQWLVERYKIVPVIENGELKGWRYEE